MLQTSTKVVSGTILKIRCCPCYCQHMDTDALIEKLKVWGAVALFFWAGWNGGSPEFLVASMATFYLGYRMHKDVCSGS